MATDSAVHLTAMENFGHGCHLQLIDGSGYVFRAFFMSERSLPERNRYRSDGVPVGAIHFFCNMLLRTLQDREKDRPPTHAAVIFDHPGKTFRNRIYSEYKANRPPVPEDLVPQLAMSRDAVRSFNFPCLELEGYEADDIIATLAARARDLGGEVTILSSDKDLMQLVGGGVTMFDPMKSKDIGRKEVYEKFFVEPEQVIDVQSLAGDSTDNVPGAPGIGIKTAALLIQEFGNLDELLERCEEIRQPKRRQSLIDNADAIRLSRRLVTLADDVPIDISFNDLEVRLPDAEQLLKFLQQQEFRTIVRRAAAYLSVNPPESVPPDNMNATGIEIEFDAYESVTSFERLEHWIALARTYGHVAVDTETDGLDEMQANLVGVSLSVGPNRACYIPLRHTEEMMLLNQADGMPISQLDPDEALARLKPMLEDPSILKIGQNVKFDAKILARYGIRLVPFDDTMLMSYALNAGLHGHSMDALSKRYLDYQPTPLKDLIGTGRSQKSFDQVPIREAVKYAAEDADITFRLWQNLRPKMHRAAVTRVYETEERPLVSVLLDMERAGIKVDRGQLSRLSQSFAAQIGELEAAIHSLAGEEFNVASPKQLGQILFEKLKFPHSKQLSRGGFATGAPILEALAADGYELPSLVLEYRKIAKLKSTYADSLLDKIHPGTGRIHTSYLISGALTGRLASTDPNLQNIPVRTEEGRRIREAFIAEDGNVLLSLDYSQIELRILAHVADITALKDAFHLGHDIHAMTASQIFGVPIDGMDPMIRRRAKAINFGVIYGISGFGLARDLKISRSEADEFIDRYFAQFPGIRSYMDSTLERARRDQFVTTIFGRKVHTPHINEKPPRRGAAERSAINAPIQGAAADIIRRAMIRIPAAIAGMPARMLLQVHDELLFEVREDVVEDVIRVVSDVMTNADRPAAQISPKLTVDAGFADNWAGAH
ncbi:MAG: DNA polymerase I [Rhodobacteraceae bacterium]|nr:DNA polymerase I [Paracoccaceae bacterium]